MTPEQLMQPRYKVIADYPGNPFMVGDVLSIVVTNMGEARHEWYEHDGLTFMYQTQMNLHPHIFQPLQWFQERKKQDIPEYVKNSKVVIKIAIGNDISESGEAWMYEKSPDGLRHRLKLSYYAPATETEYLTYLKTKSQ